MPNSPPFPFPLTLSASKVDTSNTMPLVMIAALAAVLAPGPSLDSRLAGVSGVYGAVFSAPASPGCGISGQIIPSVKEAESGDIASVFRVKASKNSYQMTFSSGRGNLFIFSGVPSVQGDRIRVRGTYKTMLATAPTRPGILGSGTFDFMVDAHDGAIINVESFNSKTKPGCFVRGALRAGVRLAPFDGKNW